MADSIEPLEPTSIVTVAAGLYRGLKLVPTSISTAKHTLEWFQSRASTRQPTKRKPQPQRTLKEISDVRTLR